MTARMGEDGRMNNPVGSDERHFYTPSILTTLQNNIDMGILTLDFVTKVVMDSRNAEDSDIQLDP